MASSVPASASCSRPSIPPQSWPWRPDPQSLDTPGVQRQAQGQPIDFTATPEELRVKRQREQGCLALHLQLDHGIDVVADAQGVVAAERKVGMALLDRVVSAHDCAGEARRLQGLRTPITMCDL